MKQESFKLDLGGAIVQNPCVKLLWRRSGWNDLQTLLTFMREMSSKTYMKCEFRTQTHGPATDHRAGWRLREISGGNAALRVSMKQESFKLDLGVRDLWQF
jgi:hypothetical protein